MTPGWASNREGSDLAAVSGNNELAGKLVRYRWEFEKPIRN